MTQVAAPPSVHWQTGKNRFLALDRPRLIGILNVTPDSFSDGGMYSALPISLDRAHEMINEGADVIDVGGQSTRPGAGQISIIEELKRTIPVIRAIRDTLPTALISIDTTRREVAFEAIRAGADIINDVSGGTEDPSLLELAAEYHCAIVLMHRLTSPALDRFSHQYEQSPDYPLSRGGVVGIVRQFLLLRAEKAIERGIAPGSIAIDPGIGFGKSVEQNYELVRQTQSFVECGHPVLCAASRKSFVGNVTHEPDPAKRALGSVAIAVWEYFQGVRLFRVHDVREHAQALAAAEAICRSSVSDSRSA